LLCRHAKLSFILNQQTADEELSTYKLAQPPETSRGIWIRKLLDKHKCIRTGLLILTLLGTCMVIGDGVLTPAISGTKFNLEANLLEPSWKLGSLLQDY
jgi:KUP system potassium uptake protein